MDLSQFDIKTIINEITKYNNNINLISHINKLTTSDFVTIFTSTQNFLADLPPSILNFYEPNILENYEAFMVKSNIPNLNLLEKIIRKCIERHNNNSKHKTINYIEAYSQYILQNTSFRPEYLHKKYPNFFSAHTLLNYSSVTLDENYICKISYFNNYTDTGFFENQPISKKIAQRLWYATGDMESKNKTLLKAAFTANKLTIHRDALVKCIRLGLEDEILTKYQLSKKEQYRAFKLIKNDEKHLQNFIETQDISKRILNYHIKDKHIHFYLAKNKFCSDDTLIKKHKQKTNKQINWLYVNAIINISKHINYVEHLLNCGEKTMVEINIEKNLNHNNPIDNIKKLQQLGIDKSLMYECMLKKVSEMDFGAHSRHTPIFAEENTK